MLQLSKNEHNKCHMVVSGYRQEQLWTQVGGDKLWESVDLNLLCVTVDRELKDLL